MNLKRHFATVLALGLAFVSRPAAAEWLEATTAHFVIYSDVPEADIRRRGEELERLDATLRRFMAVPDAPVTRSNKLNVFVAKSYEDMVSLCDCGGILGFYDSRVDGSTAFTIRTKKNDAADKTARIVFFHEYGHHFLLGNFDLAFPYWFSEGFAEFVGTAEVEPGAVLLGSAANHRAWGLTTKWGVSSELLFDPARSNGLTGAQMESIYAKGWALAHYLLFHPDVYAKFKRYMAALNGGTPGIAAAKAAFGDLKALDRAATDEAIKGLKAIRIPSVGAAAAVSVRRLSPGEQDLIELRMRSIRGVGGNQARALEDRADGVAKRYPDDPVVQNWYARMAFDADRLDAAEAAADRALATDPKSVEAIVWKARVAMRRATKAKDKDPAHWNAIRALVIRANRNDTDDALPLWLFYDSFRRQGIDPTKSATAALYRAQELAPQDTGVRYYAARQHILAGDIAAAKTLLRPLAYDAHQRGETPMDKLLAALDAGRTGKDALAVAGIKDDTED